MFYSVMHNSSQFSKHIKFKQIFSKHLLLFNWLEIFLLKSEVPNRKRNPENKNKWSFFKKCKDHFSALRL